MDSLEKASSNGSLGKNRGTAVTLNERRRAALAEIDNAKFSYVFASTSCKNYITEPLFADGST